MGLDYSFDLIFPRHQLKNVLLAVANISEPWGETPLEVVLPDETLKLPFSSNRENTPVICTTPFKHFILDICLLFPQDEPLLFYASYMSDDIIDEERRVRFGSVGLSISSTLYPDLYMEECLTFSFQPVAGIMSIVFAASENVRKTFTGLLDNYEGCLGLFVDSDYNWGPIVVWPETSPDYNPENLLVLHNKLSPNTPYYRSLSSHYNSWSSRLK